MELVARPYAVATVALVAGGLVAAAPFAGAGLASPADLHDVQLTAADALSDLQNSGLTINSGLIGAFEKFNLSLTGNNGLSTGTDTGGSETELVDKLFAGIGHDNPLHGFKEAAEQFFDGNNAVAGLGQNMLIALLGANGTVDADGNFTALNPAELNAGLFVDHHAASYLYSGLESIFAHYFGALSFAGATALGMNGDELEGSSVGNGFGTLASAIPDFNSALIHSELAFNSNLVQFELGIEHALFGDDSAANGVFNRAFNSVNMLFDTQQRLLNALIGATGYHDVDMSKFSDADYNPKGLDTLLHDGVISASNYTSPQDLTQSLLLGGDQTFNDGQIGGLQAMFGQSAAMYADLAGLLQGDGGGLAALFAGFDPDVNELSTAFTGFFAGLQDVFTPFGDLFAA